jgi:hypothetical protein
LFHTAEVTTYFPIIRGQLRNYYEYFKILVGGHPGACRSMVSNQRTKPSHFSHLQYKVPVLNKLKLCHSQLLTVCTALGAG